MDEFEIPERSALEKRYFEKARKQQQIGRIKKQVCLGKEFKGDAFIPSPRIILFKDFQKKKTYRQKITLTNVSYTFNSFKLLPLVDSIRNFFEIKYKLPGKMSAGTTCTLLITFKPQIHEDIDEYLVLLSETSKIKIPLRCYTKKVRIIASPENRQLNFGSVMIAEYKKLFITIVNDGGLPTSYNVSGELVSTYLLHKSTKKNDREIVDKIVKDSEKKIFDDKVFKVNKLKSTVNPYSQGTLEVTYFPKSVKKICTFLTLKFDDNFTKDIKFTITAEASPVSIYLKRELIDFNWTYHNTLYRDTLLIYNRGKNAMKCNFGKYMPKWLCNNVELLPKIGFVQVDKPFELQIKLKPKENLMESYRKYAKKKGIKSKGQFDFRVKMRIFIPNQTMPVYYDVKANVCSSKLSLTPNVIDFGMCNISESISVPVRIKNHSQLVQEFGFMFLPNYIRVTPNDGFFKILPNEEICINVIFSPKAQIDFKFKLACKTDLNEEYFIRCSGKGRIPSVCFSTNLIKFKPTTVGDTINQRIQLINKTKLEQTFKFDVPENAGLSVYPAFGTMKPKDQCSIIVGFQTMKEKSVMKKKVKVIKEKEEKKEKGSGSKRESKKKDSSRKKDKRKKEIENEEDKYTYIEQEEVIDNYADWECSKSGEPWSRFKNFVIPCYIPNTALKYLFLEAQISVLTPLLRVINAEGVPIEELDFGKLPIGSTKQMSFFLHNTGGMKNALNVELQYLEYSVFTIVKKSKPLKGGEKCEVVIEFTPKEKCRYSFELNIYSKKLNNSLILLKGRGNNVKKKEEVVEEKKK